MPVVGFLGSSAPGHRGAEVAALHAGLRETGYVEGQNVAIESRWAESHFDRLPALAADLIQRRVAVIAAIAAHSGDADQLFQRIPINPIRSIPISVACVSTPLDVILISVFSPDVKHG